MSFRIVGFIVMYLFFSPAFADKCPSREQIIARELSRDFEWSVDENTSLDALLAVEQLVSVTIMNQGEFVRCQYRGEIPELNLDAMPGLLGCKLTAGNSLWVSRSEGGQACLEPDQDDCRFKKVCHQEIIDIEEDILNTTE